MFLNKTAWFSDSCDVESSNIWVQHGGQLEDPSIAQYIFSDDWDHDDTKGFLTSCAYLKQHLAVFKSGFVSDAVKHGLENVSLGSYLLVPAHVLKCIDGLPANCADDNPSYMNGNDKDIKSSTRVLSKKKKLPQNHHTSSKEDEVLFLPHISSQTNGTIGSTPLFRPHTRLQSSKEKTATVRRLTRRRSPDSHVKVIASPNNRQLQKSSSSERKRNVSSRKQMSSSCKDGPLSVGSNQDKGISSQEVTNRNRSEKGTGQLNETILANIVHIGDLPKVTDVLRTVHPKGKGVLMKTKI